MDIGRTLDMRRRAAREAERLTDLQARDLAALALTVGLVQQETATGEYLTRSMGILAGLAPTLATELQRLLLAAGTYRERLHP